MDDQHALLLSNARIHPHARQCGLATSIEPPATQSIIQDSSIVNRTKSGTSSLTGNANGKQFHVIPNYQQSPYLIWTQRRNHSSALTVCCIGEHLTDQHPHCCQTRCWSRGRAQCNPSSKYLCTGHSSAGPPVVVSLHRSTLESFPRTNEALQLHMYQHISSKESEQLRHAGPMTDADSTTRSS